MCLFVIIGQMNESKMGLDAAEMETNFVNTINGKIVFRKHMLLIHQKITIKRLHTCLYTKLPLSLSSKVDRTR